MTETTATMGIHEGTLTPSLQGSKANLASQVPGWFVDSSIGVAILVAHVCLTLFLGGRILDAYDMSIPSDGGWRIYCGQVPYRDFHVPMGPMLYYIQAFFFFLCGGFTWKALLLHAGVIGGAAGALHFIMLRQFLGRFEAGIFTFFFFWAYYLPVSFPWYDHTAYLFILMGIGFWIGTQRLLSSDRTRWSVFASLLAGIALALGLFSKHNIGAVGCVLLTPLWGLTCHAGASWRQRLALIGACAIGCGLTIGAFVGFFQSHGTFLQDLFLASRSGRFTRILPGLLNELSLPELPYALDWWVLWVTSLIALIGWLIRVPSSDKVRALLASGISLLVINTFARETSSVPKGFFYNFLTPLAMALIYAALQEIRLQKAEQASWHVELDCARLTKLSAVCAAIMFLAFGLGLIQLRRAAKGNWAHLFSASPAFAAGVCVTLAAGVALTFAMRTLSRRPRGIGLQPAALAQFILISVAVGFGLIQMAVDISRRECRHMPEHRGPQAAFTTVPALAGVRTNSEYVRDYEELHAFMTKEFARGLHRPTGYDLYMFPDNQHFYGVIGVESFRGVYLWLDPNLSFKGQDPDTEAVIRGRPLYVVLKREKTVYASDYTGYYSMCPKFLSFVRANYEPIGELHGFRVLKRKSLD